MSADLRPCDLAFLADAGISIRRGPDLETLAISAHSLRDSGWLPEGYRALLLCIDRPYSTRAVHDYLNGWETHQ